MDVEVFKAEFGALGVKASLKLQSIVRLDVVQREGELLCGIVQGQECSPLIQLGED